MQFWMTTPAPETPQGPFPLKYFVADLEGNLKECATQTGTNQPYEMAQEAIGKYLTAHPEMNFQEGKIIAFNSPDNWRYTLEASLQIPISNGPCVDQDGDWLMDGFLVPVGALWEVVGNSRQTFNGFPMDPKITTNCRFQAGQGWMHPAPTSLKESAPVGVRGSDWARSTVPGTPLAPMASAPMTSAFPSLATSAPMTGSNPMFPSFSVPMATTSSPFASSNPMFPSFSSGLTSSSAPPTTTSVFAPVMTSTPNPMMTTPGISGNPMVTTSVPMSAPMITPSAPVSAPSNPFNFSFGGQPGLSL